jgi:hypothetical protein
VVAIAGQNEVHYHRLNRLNLTCDCWLGSVLALQVALYCVLQSAPFAEAQGADRFGKQASYPLRALKVQENHREPRGGQVEGPHV